MCQLDRSGGSGTAVSMGWFRLTAVGPAGIYFVYGATVEERYLTVFRTPTPRTSGRPRFCCSLSEDKENSCHQAGRRQGRHVFL